LNSFAIRFALLFNFFIHYLEKREKLMYNIFVSEHFVLFSLYVNFLVNTRDNIGVKFRSEQTNKIVPLGGVKMDKPDRRIEKTRTAIYQALSDLLQEKRYANITIQEIIDRANVGRTTFYQHFTDKDALLSNCIETIFESLSGHLTEQVPPNHESRIIPVAELLTHIMENRRLINGILMSESGELLFDKFKSYWSKKIEPYLLAHLPNGKQPKVPIDILTNYVTSSLIELLKWWNKSGEEYTPKQMEEYFFALILPSISSILRA